MGCQHKNGSIKYLFAVFPPCQESKEITTDTREEDDGRLGGNPRSRFVFRKTELQKGYDGCGRSGVNKNDCRKAIVEEETKNTDPEIGEGLCKAYSVFFVFS